MNKGKEKVVVILGATATGKSNCAIELAKNIMARLFPAIRCWYTVR